MNEQDLRSSRDPDHDLIHETIDELRDFDLKIIQPRCGYRFSVDPLLLCGFAGPAGGGIVDLGTGCGVIALIMARMSPGAQVVGVESHTESAVLAERNVSLNGLAGQVSIICADILDLNGRIPVSSFDLVLANPPFRRKGTGKISPQAGRDTARHESSAGLGDFLAVAKYLVRPSGRICLIYHISRLAELIASATTVKLALVRMQFVHGSPLVGARMVMVELVKGRCRELEVLAPLYPKGNDQYMQIGTTP